MGAGSSSVSGSVPTPKQGLHVLRVTPSSPASQTSIEPFFDFIIGADAGQNYEADNLATTLERIVDEHEGQTLRLYVWSCKTQDTRTVSIVPSRAWSTGALNGKAHASAENARPSLLGLSMRVCQPALALDNVWHVLDVLEGSPAEMAGLVPYGDWVIGWSGGALSEEGDFYDVVEAHIEKPLRIYVYSYDFDTIREVVVIPNRHWGGEGLLGCVFGFGLLHRIPSPPPDRQSGWAPPEFDTGSNITQREISPTSSHAQDLFVPADVARTSVDRRAASPPISSWNGHSVSRPTSASRHHDGHHEHDHGHRHDVPRARASPTFQRQPLNNLRSSSYTGQPGASGSPVRRSASPAATTLSPVRSASPALGLNGGSS